jgi:hypothetical protein
MRGLKKLYPKEKDGLALRPFWLKLRVKNRYSQKRMDESLWKKKE